MSHGFIIFYYFTLFCLPAISHYFIIMGIVIDWPRAIIYYYSWPCAIIYYYLTIVAVLLWPLANIRYCMYIYSLLYMLQGGTLTYKPTHFDEL